MDQTYSLESFLNHVQKRDPNQTEFAQAVREVMTTLWPFLEQNPKYRQMSLLERLVEPERVIQFRVVWADDRNQCRSTVHGVCSSALPSARTKAVCASIRQLTSPFSNSSASNKPSKCPDYSTDGRW